MVGITEITLNGEVKELRFGNYAFEKYNKLTGTNAGAIKELNEDYLQLDMVADIIYCGLFGSYRVNKKVIDFTIDEIKQSMDSISYIDQLVVIREFMSCVVNLTEQMNDALKAMNHQSDNNTDSEKKK
jgi:hypothetical protein